MLGLMVNSWSMALLRRICTMELYIFIHDSDQIKLLGSFIGFELHTSYSVSLWCQIWSSMLVHFKSSKKSSQVILVDHGEIVKELQKIQCCIMANASHLITMLSLVINRHTAYR